MFYTIIVLSVIMLAFIGCVTFAWCWEAFDRIQKLIDKKQGVRK